MACSVFEPVDAQTFLDAKCTLQDWNRRTALQPLMKEIPMIRSRVSVEDFPRYLPRQCSRRSVCPEWENKRKNTNTTKGSTLAEGKFFA